MISFRVDGNTKNLDAFLARILRDDLYASVEKHARAGVEALRRNTPEETGLTADSWDFEIERTLGGYTVWFLNTNVINGFNVAIGLQYGHGTGTGGWVEGTDFINPALKRIFDQMADDVWKEVQRS